MRHFNNDYAKPVTLRQLHLLYLRQIRLFYLYISVLGKVISKIAPGTNVPRINARRFEDKANQNLLTGEAHIERFLNRDAIHARMRKLHVHWGRICVFEIRTFHSILNYLHSCLTM